MANTLNAFRYGAVGFIDWLGSWVLNPHIAPSRAVEAENVFYKAFDEDYLAMLLIPIRCQFKSAVAMERPFSGNDRVRIGKTIR